MNEIVKISEEHERLVELEALFEKMWDADMRGVAVWRLANPGNDLTLPDRAKFTEWMLTQISIERTAKDGYRKQWEAHSNTMHQLQSVIDRYVDALVNRKNGNTAQNKAFDEIAEILGRHPGNEMDAKNMAKRNGQR
jgi:hypothetical protein